MEFSEGELQSLRVLIEAVRDYRLDVQLPEVVVIGGTSTGKSSLLSAIGGFELPSKTDMCTCCPTRLILEYSKEAADVTCHARVAWAEPGRGVLEEEVPNLAALKDVVARMQVRILETDRLQDPQKGTVSSSVIEVRLKGRQLPDLTLTDLPGTMGTAKEGQPKTLPGEIDALLEKYCRNPRCIIVAVHPAASNICNSQLQYLKEKFDPDASRIMPVLTKPDLVDPGTESSVAKLIHDPPKEYPRGFHIVKCRGQQDQGLSIEEGMAAETKYFSSIVWANLPPEHVGCAALRRRLSNIYLEHIRGTMPKVIADLTHQLADAEAFLEKFAEVADQEAVRRLPRKFCNALSAHLFVECVGNRKRSRMEDGGPLEDTRSEWWPKIRGLTEGGKYTLRSVIEAGKRELARKNLLSSPFYMEDISVGSKVEIEGVKGIYEVARLILPESISGDTCMQKGTEFVAVPANGTKGISDSYAEACLEENQMVSASFPATPSKNGHFYNKNMDLD